ncbi:MAG: hypothetical protein JNJ42_08870 [Burkholderiaceae bacterium]|jgi:hypothetical protein|nr:hypothetical protein [Burkholderiaceae bacterium]
MSMRLLAAALHAAVLAAPLVAGAQGSTVYRCPGNVYTSEISEREAKERNCRTIEGAPITIVNTAKPAPQARGKDGEGRAASAPRGADSRVDPTAQRQRDSDARKILEAELAREEARLVEMKREFNNGEPERRGDERNYAKYQDRVAEMKAAITRKEADIAAIRRELTKLQQQ